MIYKNLHWLQFILENEIYPRLRSTDVGHLSF